MVAFIEKAVGGARACAMHGPDNEGGGAPGAPEGQAPSPIPTRAEACSSLGDAAIGSVLAAKRAVREQGIDAAFSAMREVGGTVDRFVAMMRYDFELAPLTSNRRQLEEIGVVLDSEIWKSGSDVGVRLALWRIIYGLERLGIYLIHTDHLSDRRMLFILLERVLVEQVRDVVGSGDFSEYIDLGASDEHEPDGLDGPFEHRPEQDDGGFERGGGPRPKPALADRDRFLPTARSPVSRGEKNAEPTPGGTSCPSGGGLS